MEEDYYSGDEDEKVDVIVRIYFANKINNIMKNAKFEIKDYLKAIVYLTQNQLNKLYKGNPITLNLRAHISKPKTNIFDFLVKDRSNLPSIIYISHEQSINYLYYASKYSTKKFKITFTKNQLSATLKEIKKVNKQIDSFFKDLKDKN